MVEKKERKMQYTHAALVIMIFLIAWGVPQGLGAWTTTPLLLQQVLFSILFTGVAGCLIPLLVTMNWSTQAKGSRKNWLWGLLMLVVAIVFAVGLSGAGAEVLRHPPSVLMLGRYLLLFFPMAMALSLVGFLMFDLVFAHPAGYAAVTALFFALGFYVDSAFSDLELAFLMGVLGFLLALAHKLHGSFWLSFGVLFVILIFNTLAEAKYDSYPLLLVVLSTLLTCLILFIFRQVLPGSRRT